MPIPISLAYLPETLAEDVPINFTYSPYICPQASDGQLLREKPRVMQLNSALLTAAGIFAALAAQYAGSKTASKADIRIECLTWAILSLTLGFQRYFTGRRLVANDGDAASENSLPVLNSTIWSVSICISIAQITSLYYSVESNLPLVTVVTFLFSSRSSRAVSTLPGPVSVGGALARLSATFGPGSRRMQWLRNGAIVALGAWCYFLLLPIFQKHYSIMACLVFTITRALSFALLEACREHELSPFNNRLSCLHAADAISFRVFCITAGCMLILPSHTILEWPMLVQALGNAVKQGAVFILILLDCATSATTIETYSLTAIQSFTPGNFLRSFSLGTAAIISLTQCVICLPSSAVGGRILLVLGFIPLLSLLNYRFSDSHFGWYRHASLPEVEPGRAVHPIARLAAQGDDRFRQMIARQSKTLEDACAEYERRYGRKPPPHFDRWFQAARENKFLLIDEFDVMMEAIEPLWGVPAADILGRVENALNAGQMSMIRFAISDHHVSHTMENFASWMADQITGWFSQEMLDTLPDLVFAVNVMDEPKVVVAHDALEEVLSKARAALQNPTGRDPELSQQVEFIQVGKQNAWEALTMSCPIDSPSRAFSKTTASSTVSEVGLLSNLTMSKDICLYPELRNLHALLQAPESLAFTHSLVPVFSQAKPSSFQDLLYPSPWYAAKIDMMEYRERDDIDWEQKENIVYWTGSNTGGHSTMDNWRSLQRQRLVLLTMDKDRPVTLMRKSDSKRPSDNTVTWKAYNSTIASISSSLKIRMSAVIQCEEDACRDQKAAFGLEGEAKDELGASYAAKYNLDLDGNGFSGRFYRLLRSKSAVLKQTIYKEWHDDWLIPWVHYIPVSMNLKDFPEIVRYMSKEPDGLALGQKIADQSRDWSNKVLRKIDMRLVFWRLLLEYARVVDENREQMHCCS